MARYESEKFAKNLQSSKTLAFITCDFTLKSQKPKIFVLMHSIASKQSRISAKRPPYNYLIIKCTQELKPKLNFTTDMGIKQLSRLISEMVPSAVCERKVSHYFNRILAVDASMCLYQFLVAITKT